MRKSLLIPALIGLLAFTPAQAQVGFGGSFPGPGTPASAGGGGYSGPGDLKGYIIWWGVYAFSAADRGTAAVNVCNASDANCADLSTDATTGLLNVSGTNVGANPCNDSTNICTIKKWYNKGSTGSTHDLTQSTISSRATLLVSCTGLTGSACATSTGNATYVSGGSISSTAQPYTTTAVSYRNTSVAAELAENDASGYDMGGGWFLATNDAFCQNNGTALNPSATDGNWYGKACRYQGATSAMAVNTSVTTGTIGTLNLSGTPAFMSRNGGDRKWQGKMASSGISTASFSDTDLTDSTNASKTILGY